MQPNDDNKIKKGIYILSAPILDELNVVKFGMSECLQNRVNDYRPYFNSSYYMACYELTDDHSKKEIISIEIAILNLTIQYKAPKFNSEYRKIDYETLHNIVYKFLDSYNIPYVMHIKPIWKVIKNKPKNVVNKSKINRYDNMFGSKFNLANNIELQQSILDNDIQPYKGKNQCLICNRIFRQKCHLDNHLNKQKKCSPPIQQQIVIVQKEIQQSTENIYLCDECGHKFNRKDRLTRHIKKNCKIIKAEKITSQGTKIEQDMLNKKSLIELENRLLREQIKGIKKDMEIIQLRNKLNELK